MSMTEPTMGMSCTFLLSHIKKERVVDQKSPIHTLSTKMSSIPENPWIPPKNSQARSSPTMVSNREVSTGSSIMITQREFSKEISHTVPPGRIGALESQARPHLLMETNKPRHEQ